MKFDGTEGQLEIIREIAESLTDPVFLVDRAFNVWYHNRAMESAVGIRMSSKRYRQTPCHKLLGLEICEHNCIMKRAVEKQQNVRLAEIAGTTAGGESVNFHINAVPVINTSGTAFGALIFLRDITAETQIHQKYKDLVARNTAISMSGTIEQGNLPDIIQLFSFLQKTGYLNLKYQDQEGQIVFESGQMIYLSLGAAKGEKAFGRMLTWQQGDFSFRPEEKVEVTERVKKSSDFILMDALRETDELSVRKNELPTFDTKPNVLRIANQAEDEIDDLEWHLYELGLQSKSVEEMQAKSADHTDIQVLMGLLRLLDKGIIKW